MTPTPWPYLASPLTLLAGPEPVATSVAADLTARLTHGQPFPGQPRRTHRPQPSTSVLWLASSPDAASNALDLAGADPTATQVLDASTCRHTRKPHRAWVLGQVASCPVVILDLYGVCASNSLSLRLITHVRDVAQAHGRRVLMLTRHADRDVTYPIGDRYRVADVVAGLVEHQSGPPDYWLGTLRTSSPEHPAPLHLRHTPTGQIVWPYL